MRQAVKGIGCIVGGVIVLALLIQLVPVNHTNPPVVTTPQWDSPQTKALFDRACADCHSNYTGWPWWTYVAPGSWLAVHDVEDGRRAWNISDPNSGRGGREGGEGGGDGGNRFSRVIERGSMPPLQYLVLHPNASLSAAEKQQLITGLQATFSNSNPSGMKNSVPQP